MNFFAFSVDDMKLYVIVRQAPSKAMLVGKESKKREESEVQKMLLLAHQ